MLRILRWHDGEVRRTKFNKEQQAAAGVKSNNLNSVTASVSASEVKKYNV